MFRPARKSTPKVTDGKVRKKNNWGLSPDYYYAPDSRTVLIDRQRPGIGYKHVLRTTDIHRFLGLLPDWNNLAVGLNAIVLATHEYNVAGYCGPGVVAVCAWESGLWTQTRVDFYEDHRAIFERLGVECEPLPNGDVLCKWDEPAVRAFQLLHILLHELGHHHDRMTTRKQRRTGRGESYAEEYALRYEAAIWDSYHKAFGR
jgi:hypothetical protein